jgi:hypothetical protein
MVFLLVVEGQLPGHVRMDEGDPERVFFRDVPPGSR